MTLAQFASAPIIVVRPRVSDHGVLDFSNIDVLVKEGIRAAKRVLTGNPLLA